MAIFGVLTRDNLQATMRASTHLSSMCMRCGGACMYDGVHLRDGIKYHHECLSCADCGVMIEVDDIYCLMEGTLYCKPCGDVLYGKICAVCHDEILEGCKDVGGLSYHPQHFWCSFCQTPIEDDDVYTLKEHEDGSSRPYCEECLHYSVGESGYRTSFQVVRHKVAVVWSYGKHYLRRLRPSRREHR